MYKVETFVTAEYFYQVIHFLLFILVFLFRSFIAVENIEKYCVLISSKAVYFLKSGDYTDREAIFLEVKYDDLYHCLVSKDHGKVYVQLTKKAVNTSSGVAMPGPSQQKPMVRTGACWVFHAGFLSPSMHVLMPKYFYSSVFAFLHCSIMKTSFCQQWK